VPLAKAAAIGFLAPFIVALLAWPLLGEQAKLRRMLAVAAAFLGVLVGAVATTLPLAVFWTTPASGADAVAFLGLGALATAGMTAWPARCPGGRRR
jgi:drug/metabolite transporter (DMT)-like permease